MRFGNRGSFRTSVAHFMKRKEFRKILVTNLGLNFDEVNEFFNTNREIFNFPRHRVISNFLMYQKYNINARPLDNFRLCLKLLDYKLEHRINILKEIGVLELNSSLLSNIAFLFKKHTSPFKEKTNIPVEQNITRNLFDKLGYDVPNQISELESKNKLTMRQYYDTCLLYCKSQVFDLPYLDDKIFLNSYMKFKSICMIADTLKILRIDLGYDKEMIKHYPSVIIASADNIKTLLNEFTDICGVPIVTLLRKYPYMLFQNADNIKRLLTSINHYEISDECVRNCIKIFNLNNDTFLERMEKIKQNPNLNVWCKHPRFLQIVLYKNMVENHMKYLYIIDRLKWACPHAILSCPLKIEKRIQTSNSINLSKKALKYVLIKELGVDKSDLLTRHQHWKTVGFVDIEQMLQYLKKHFTITEICQNLQIILYAQSKVEKILAELKQQYSQSTEYSFTNSQYLALCLYMLEKDTHFTGDGIWSNGLNMKQQISEEDITKSSESNTDVNSSMKNSDDIY